MTLDDLPDWCGQELSMFVAGRCWAFVEAARVAWAETTSDPPDAELWVVSSPMGLLVENRRALDRARISEELWSFVVAERTDRLRLWVVACQ